MVFLLCPHGSVLLHRIPYFSIPLLLSPYLLTSAFPSLSITTYSLRCMMFPLQHLHLMVLEPKKNRGRDDDCFTASPKEERLQIQLGFRWQLNCPVFKTFSLSQWQLCRNSPSFRCYSPKPAYEFAVARSCSIHHVLSTTHCIINWTLEM